MSLRTQYVQSARRLNQIELAARSLERIEQHLFRGPITTMQAAAVYLSVATRASRDLTGLILSVDRVDHDTARRLQRRYTHCLADVMAAADRINSKAEAIGAPALLSFKSARQLGVQVSGTVH